MLGFGSRGLGLWGSRFRVQAEKLRRRQSLWLLSAKFIQDTMFRGIPPSSTATLIFRSYEENQDNGFTVGDLCTAEEEDLCVAW